MIRLFGHHIDVPAIFLALFELSVFGLLIFAVDRVIAALGIPVASGTLYAGILLLLFLTSLSLLAVGLYSRDHCLRWEDVLSRVIVVLPIIAIVAEATLLIYHGIDDDQHLKLRGNALLCFASLTLYFPVFLAIRWSFIHLIDQTGMFTRKVLVIGSGTRAAKLEQLGEQHMDRSFMIVGYVKLGDPPEAATPNKLAESRRRSDRREDYWVQPSDLPDFCTNNGIKEVVVASTERRGMPIREFLKCKVRGIKMTEFATFWEREARYISLEELNPSWLVFSDGFSVGIARAAVKRAFDILTSLLLLLITLPVTLITAILVKLESPGPLFYLQERVGQNGQSFTIMKFRSMRADAEKNGPRWAAVNDPRVTRVGAIIRKIRIDEIPQVLNVLKGDMAFVGPRPERPIFVRALEEKIPYYSERHVAKPGITGWAQINYPYGATEEDAKMKLSYDLYYIKNGGLFLDILIIIQTIKVLLWNSGAR